MSIRLHIGILDPQPGWVIVLRQIGVPFEPVYVPDGLTPERYAVLIVNRFLSNAEHAAVDRYLSGGGAVLDTGFFLRVTDPGGFSRGYVRHVTPDQSPDGLFAGITGLDLHCPTRNYAAARDLDGLVYIDEYGRGALAHLAVDLNACILDTRTTRRAFYSPSGTSPNEIVSLVSKGALRSVVERILRRLCRLRGIPFAHLWRFPDDLPSVFCYRVDSDYGTLRQFRELHSVARQYDMRLTWFLHTGAHEGWLDRLHSFAGQEFAVHCHRHRTFPGFDENMANITEARAVLDAVGIPYQGYAAPNGFWNTGLAAAIEANGFLYSSEFSLDYDNLPFNPSVRRRFSPVMQIPAHPVCIGSLIKARETEQGMNAYHRHVAASRVAAGEPVMFYHHPPHEHWDVVADTFAFIRNQGIRNLTFGEYARWWLRRGSTRVEVEYTAEGFEVSRSNDDPSVRLRVVMPDDSAGFIRDPGETARGDVRWEKLTEQIPGADQNRRPRRNLLRLMRNTVEDFNARIRQ